jgi:hypothetical protein
LHNFTRNFLNYKMQNCKYFFSIIFLFTFSFLLRAQAPTDSIIQSNETHSKRLKIVAITEGTFVVTSYTAFYFLWYKDFEHSKFHFFNDGREWLGMDKLGHSFSSYWLSTLNSKAFSWAGLNHNKSAIWGSLSSFLYMFSIELLDGYSQEWGASVWDLAANASGSSLYLAQELLFDKQFVLLKYSYYPSNYSHYRPAVLGNSFGEKLIKDYNATTFWLSFDLNGIVSPKIPKWLNLAFGYGATGMTGGFENYLSPDCNCKPVPDSERMRKYYLSIDIDLSKIPVKSRFLKGLLFTLNSIKFPAPTLGYSKKGWQMLIR